MKNKILVTGAAGCLGANLVKELSKDTDNEINILIHRDRWHPYLNGLKLNVFYGDIRSKKDVAAAIKGCNQVYQAAGVVSYNKIDNHYIHSTHVGGVINVLKQAMDEGVQKVVVTASTAGIGIPENKEEPLDEEAPFDLKKYKKVMYMYSKHKTINICKAFSKKGLNVSMLSPTTFYGSGDISMHIGKVVKKIKEGKMRFAPPGGNACVSIEDAVDAHILVMEKGKSGENYIIANEFMSYLEMFNRLAKLLGVEKIDKTLPRWILPPAKLGCALLENTMLLFNKKPLLSPSSINFTFKYRYFDSSKIRKELGWKPKVGFDETMRRAIEFYEEQGLI